MKKPINLLQLSSRQSTLAFLLSSAHRELFDTHSLIIEHSFADGLFCHRENWEPISQNEIDKLSAKIDKWLKNEKEIELTTAPLSKLIAIFEKEHLKNKPINLRKWNVNPVPAVRFGQHIDYRIQPMETDKKLLKFEIQKYNNGLLLRFPTITHPNSIPPFQDCQRLFSIIEEYEQWGTIIGVESIPHLNEHIHKNGIKELVWISEGLHEKKISQIADALVEEFPKKRVIYIAGPTSSGKTTFAKRLSIHIKVNGFNTHQLSMDDYFVGRGEIPFDENGFQNYEAFDVLDRNLLCERINRMLNGDEIPIRKFDFNQGKSFDFEEFVKLEDNDFIILEGIHGLNPKLTSLIDDGNVQRIYVSAITQLNIDAVHRLSTSDNRLLRRLVRDVQFRGYSPTETLQRWNSVRLGEEKNIFPFQGEADLFFNSALAYELPVLSTYTSKLLEEVSFDNSTQDDVDRLLTLLAFFEPLKGDIVPGTSILREFIGGSEFDY